MRKVLLLFSISILLAGCRPKVEPHKCLDNIAYTHWFIDADGTKYAIGYCTECPYESEEGYWVGDYYYSGGSSPELEMYGFVNDEYCEDYDYVYSKVLEAMRNDQEYKSVLEE